MDQVATISKVLDETNRVVDGIEPSQLDNPTPCAEWTVRDVLNHITGGATMFAMSCATASMSDEKLGRADGGDNLGDDYKASFRRGDRRRRRGVRRARRGREDGQAAVRRDAGRAGDQHRDLRRRDAHVGSRQGHRAEHRPRPRGARRRLQGRAGHADRRPPQRRRWFARADVPSPTTHRPPTGSRRWPAAPP